MEERYFEFRIWRISKTSREKEDILGRRKSMNKCKEAGKSKSIVGNA